MTSGEHRGDAMRGRVVLVTGSTDGIGKATALGLAKIGATVVLHGRSKDRCLSTADEIRRLSGNTQIDFVVADLSSQKQIRRLADDITGRYTAIHVLVNNAGVYLNDRSTTEDGLEMTFAVNHAAPFLLTLLLLDSLRSGAPSRIVNVSSVTHMQARLDFDNLQGEKKYHPYGAYAISKLGNILFTYEIAERLRGTQVTANCLHPGVIATKLLKAGFPTSGGSSTVVGAATSVFLASAPELEGVTGKYYVNMKQESSSPTSHHPDIRRRLWDVTARLCNLSADSFFS